MLTDTSKLINECLRLGNVFLKKHALTRMVERKIAVSEIEEALENFSIIESYLEDKRLPGYLLLGHTQNNRALHILTALDKIESYIWVITVYEPTKKKWDDQFIKRKQS
ncbi:MAG: DUF4258 domain-containing protein [Ignavibacteria bacterium]